MKCAIFLLWVIYLTPITGIWYDCEPCRCRFTTEQSVIARCIETSIKLRIIPKNLNTAVQELFVRGQQIKTIYKNNFEFLNRLQKLDILKNDISTVEDYAFKNLKKLQELTMSHNKITTLPTNIFRDTPQLTKIYLDYNKIITIQKDLFSNLRLEIVHLQNNNLLSIQENSFANLHLLSDINLSYNNFAYISPKIFSNLKTMIKVSLSNNPWNCDVHLCELMNITVTQTWDKFSNPICLYPNNKEGKSWRQILNRNTPTITSTVKYIEDENVTLYCDVCTTSKIIWNNNDQIILKNIVEVIDKYSSRSILTVENTNNNNGIYSCKTQNCEQCEEDSVYLNITRRSLPTEKKIDVKSSKSIPVVSEGTSKFTEDYMSTKTNEYTTTSNPITHETTKNITNETLKEIEKITISTSARTAQSFVTDNGEASEYTPTSTSTRETTDNMENKTLNEAQIGKINIIEIEAVSINTVLIIAFLITIIIITITIIFCILLRQKYAKLKRQIIVVKFTPTSPPIVRNDSNRTQQSETTNSGACHGDILLNNQSNNSFSTNQPEAYVGRLLQVTTDETQNSNVHSRGHPENDEPSEFRFLLWSNYNEEIPD